MSVARVILWLYPHMFVSVARVILWLYPHMFVSVARVILWLYPHMFVSVARVILWLYPHMFGSVARVILWLYPHMFGSVARVILWLYPHMFGSVASPLQHDQVLPGIPLALPPAVHPPPQLPRPPPTPPPAPNRECQPRKGGGGVTFSLTSCNLSLLVFFLPGIIVLLSRAQGSQHFINLKCPDISLRKVKQFHEKYFHFKEVAGKSRGGSNTSNCYCLERCVIFTLHKHLKVTIASQSMNTTWTHGTRRTYAKLAKTYPFWVSVKFP